MLEKRFELPKCFYETLLDGMREALQTRGKTTSDPKFFAKVHGDLAEEHLPTTSNLKKFIESAFWASLGREEGRPLSFSVFYDRPCSSNKETVSFTPPIKYESRSLTKLAPAVGSAANSVAVFIGEDGELVIWGIRKTAFPIPKLSLNVLDPGYLSLNFDKRLIGAITGDPSVITCDGALNRSKYVWHDLMPKPDPWGEGLQRWECQLELMKLIVREVREMGHGGTIILVPPNEEWESSVDKPLYQLDGQYIPTSDLLDAFIDGIDGVESIEYWRRLEEAARSIAELSGVDGAVVMTTEFVVLGFGVMLKNAAENNEEVHIFDLLRPREQAERKALKELSGSRHQSAARFVNKQKKAVAFVVSQDRNVTAIAWRGAKDKPEEGGLSACRRLELTIY